MNSTKYSDKTVETISKILGYAFIFTVAIIIIATFVTIADLFWILIMKIF